MKCVKCGLDCERDEVDVGVGVIYGPWGCCCGWSEDPYYDSSSGDSLAQKERPDWIIDPCGGMIHKGSYKQYFAAGFPAPREDNNQ